MRADLLDLRVLRAALLALALLVLAAVPGPARADDTDPATTSVEVSDAVLRWGMSNEANNAAFAAGTFNFFSAGKIADPGRGNVALTSAGWSQRAGNVAIEKWNGTAYRPATWAGIGTDPAGVAISGPGSGRYSGHQYVFSGGAGTVDPAAGTARISWTGDVTVLFYSGYTFFYLSDPVLEVADGTGTLTASVSGFGSTREDPDAWVAIPARTVTVANLPDVDLEDPLGFNALPAYDGVTTTLDGVSATDSFPQSFVSFAHELGMGPFWRASGSAATDPAKKALPVTVSYDASAPVVPEEPEPQKPNPVVENDAPPPPKVVTTTVTRTTTVAAPTAPVVPDPAPTAAAVGPLTTSPVLALVAAASPASPAERTTSWAWWLGGGFLLLAAALVVSTSLAPLPAPRPPA